MEGKLMKTNIGWCVNYIDGILPILPSKIKYYFLDDEDEGKLVYCKIITRLEYDYLKRRSIEIPAYVELIKCHN